jgi:Ca-activated chloride channel family protein
VEVYATVSDGSGAPVTGLGSSDFEVFEDGRPQAIQVFTAGDFPLSVALAIDHSASMAGSRLPLAASAATRFLGRLRPEDQVMILAVSSDVAVLAPLSRDRAAQARAIDGLRPWSATSLNDAVIAGIDLIQPARGRRGLVILSDGEDRYSEAQPAEVLDRARRADVLVYPIAVGRNAPALFAELAALTGGRSFHPRDGKAIDRALADIALELRTQYLLGYAPARQAPASPEARWHTIEVRVRTSGLRVRARDGYFGP